MGWLFDMNNPVMRWIIRLFDCICLSILWIVTCLPIVTVGAATTALFATVHRYIRLEEGGMLRVFFRAFRENFKRSTLCFLVALLVLALLIVDAMVFRTMALNGQLLGSLYWLILLLISLAVTWLTYLFAYVERFTGGVKDTLRVSFLMLILHPLRSLTMMALLLGSAALILLAPGLLAIVPALCCWLCDRIAASVFVLHIREEDRERLENSRLESAEDV